MVLNFVLVGRCANSFSFDGSFSRANTPLVGLLPSALLRDRRAFGGERGPAQLRAD
jgi:hypothetical protein